jgi:hypothetical protein
LLEPDGDLVVVVVRLGIVLVATVPAVAFSVIAIVTVIAVVAIVTGIAIVAVITAIARTAQFTTGG